MIKNRMQMRGQGGFTLIELLVVIAILAVLAGVVVFAVGNSVDNAKKAACDTELAAVKTAIAAAETANHVNDPNDLEEPGDYLSDHSSTYIRVDGDATNGWSPAPVLGSGYDVNCDEI